MKIKHIIYAAMLASAVFTGCSERMEEGHSYPALALGTETQKYVLDQVMQNTTDVKPYLKFFDEVTLELSYVDGVPDKLRLSEKGAPFRVTSREYDDVLELEWEINTAKSPYEIRVKGEKEPFCYITRDRIVTFPFQLGAPSNKYEYRFAVVKQEEPSQE